MRYLYSGILYLLLPWVLLRLWLKGRHVPGYRRNWKERFGFVDVKPAQSVVWFHAVSVGEVRAAEPLIRAVRKRYPDLSVLVTTTTPTGRETAQQLLGNDVSCHYIPYDLPAFVRRFLNAVKPTMVIILETEIWPSLYHQLAQKSIPLLLVNARLSKKSLQGYLRLRALSQQAVRSVWHIAAQSEQDAQRFKRLGAYTEQLSVMGNLKFEMRLPDDFSLRVRTLQDRLGQGRSIWVAGSTHVGEDAQLLAAHQRVQKSCAGALLVIAPRHPERAADISSLCRKSGIESQLSSAMTPLAGNVEVLIIDTLGELVYFYGVARVVFVGGSLVPVGGHNPIEPVLAGAPVISGPDTANFSNIYQDMIRSNAARMVKTEKDLADQVCEWFADEAQRKLVGEAGLALIESNRGALQHTQRLLENRLQLVADNDSVRKQENRGRRPDAP